MLKLTEEQIQVKKDFIRNYIKPGNAADSSKLDANANVSSKNIATLNAEMPKDINLQVNRSMIKDIIEEKYGKELGNEYVRQLESHEIYCHDETSLNPYCVSISLYPFLLNGLKDFGGESIAPHHLQSFNGGFVNLLFAISAQFAGAVATPEWLLYFDYFARQDYGDNYLEEHEYIIENMIQHTVYALNQPAAARGFQSVFWNISVFDKNYYDSLFGNFIFPDMTEPNWETFSKLQKYFMKWFNKERTVSLLTFPVVTAAGITDNIKYIDDDFNDMITTELAEGNSFFLFNSDSPYALSSCCRLKNIIEDQINDFSYSLGAGGVSTGSLNVITLNVNRLVQDGRDLKVEIQKIHKYQMAFRELFDKYIKGGMLPVYDAGFIDISRQYLTIGVNGIVEAAEFLGFAIDNNEPYKEWVRTFLKVISDENKEASKKYGVKFNTEFPPAENLGVKNAKWDRADGYVVNRDCYNSYLYKVEDNDISVIDKLILHGGDTSKFLDGGSACHVNLESYPTKEAFDKLISVGIQEGCEYFGFNIKVTGCNKCGYIDKRTLQKCSKCGSKDIWWATRVIGYLKKIKDFSTERQNEEDIRFYDKTTL